MQTTAITRSAAARLTKYQRRSEWAWPRLTTKAAIARTLPITDSSIVSVYRTIRKNVTSTTMTFQCLQLQEGLVGSYQSSMYRGRSGWSYKCAASQSRATSEKRSSRTEFRRRRSRSLASNCRCTRPRRSSSSPKHRRSPSSNPINSSPLLRFLPCRVPGDGASLLRWFFRFPVQLLRNVHRQP